MGSTLPQLSRSEFTRRLTACSPAPLSARAQNALWAHFRELDRWNPRLSLVGPGTGEKVVERHYGEALAALPLLGAARTLLDVGSGGGFPGLVLAAARPDLEVTLVEARERKWSFLVAAVRRAELSVRCLNARVGAAHDASLGSSYDLVTWRALRLPDATVAGLQAISRRMLVWCASELPVVPTTWRCGREVELSGSVHRRIVELLPVTAEEARG